MIDKYVKLFHSEVSCYMFDELLTHAFKVKDEDVPWTFTRFVIVYTATDLRPHFLWGI